MLSLIHLDFTDQETPPPAKKKRKWGTIIKLSTLHLTKTENIQIEKNPYWLPSL